MKFNKSKDLNLTKTKVEKMKKELIDKLVANTGKNKTIYQKENDYEAQFVSRSKRRTEQELLHMWVNANHQLINKNKMIVVTIILPHFYISLKVHSFNKS